MLKSTGRGVVHRTLLAGSVFALALSAYAPPGDAALTCDADPTRTLFAGGPDTGNDNPPGACRQFDGNQALCNQAFHLGGDGIASCFYDTEQDECLGCGPGENEQDGDCTNTCFGTPTCAADPTRTNYVGGPDIGQDGSACRQFDGDQANCLTAFHRNSIGALASCYFDNDECRGCGPDNQGDGECTNTCVTSPICQQDPARTIFAGGPDTGDDFPRGACRQFDADSTMCGEAYHLGGDGNYSSCFPTTDCERCEGGNRRQGNAGGAQGAPSTDPPCISECVPTCADQTRTAFVGGSGTGGCHTFDGDQSGCSTAFHLSGKGPASCWYDANSDVCLGCGPNNEGGNCTNTCAPPVCPARTNFVAGSGACQSLNGDQAGCEAAFHRTNGGSFASCFYDTNNASCRGCGSPNQADGNCTNACDNTAPCALDPTRTIFAGRRGSGACRQFDGDATSCNQAFHTTAGGNVASCFYDATEDECFGCGPANLNDGRCTNSCAATPICSNTALTLNECDNFDGNPTACGAAFEQTHDGPVSCVVRPRCLGCGLFNESLRECTNTCESGPASTEDGFCDDGLDNDGDNLTDCGDSDCAGDPACAAPAPVMSWQALVVGMLAMAGIGLYRLRTRGSPSST